MFSSKSVIREMGDTVAKSFLSEDGIVFSDSTELPDRERTGESLSHAASDPVRYSSFLGTIFHQGSTDNAGSAEESGEEEAPSFPAEREAPFSAGAASAGAEVPEADFLPAARSGIGEITQQSIERAEKLLEVSRREAEKIREEARLKGYEQGLREGRQDGRRAAMEELRQEHRAAMDQFYKDCALALGTIEELKRKRLSRYLDELKDVAVAVAEKVIHVSLRSSGEVIRKMILQEAEKLKKTAWLKIYMDKAEYEMLLETDSAIASELSGVSRSIRFMISEKSERGKLIMETPDEIVDLSIRTQMENLRTKLSQLEPREEQEK